MDYLTLPLLPTEGYFGRTELRESIVYSLGLLLSTRIGAIRFYPEYGCGLWDKEYSDVLMANKADVRAALRNAIAQFEKRLYNVSVSFTPEKSSLAHILGMQVRVRGNYRDEEKVEKDFDATFNVG